MERETASDWQRAVDDPHGFLPGLMMRVRWQGADELLADVTADSRSPEDREAAFLVAANPVTFESSILAHEGRHVIDKRINPRFSSEELEYRAKLSEVAFAEYPRLAFNGILTGSEGSGTPHGRANQRVRRGLAEWMEEHVGDIEGIDPGRPLLPQFDLLSNEQLVEAMQSMDPLVGRWENPAH